MATENQQLVKGTTTILVLAALAREPRHGYGLVRDLEASTEGLLQFKEGTIYPLLYFLEDRALIRSEWTRGSSGRKQKIYHLTPAGKKRLESRLADWRKLVQGMSLALGES